MEPVLAHREGNMDLEAIDRQITQLRLQRIAVLEAILRDQKTWEGRDIAEVDRSLTALVSRLSAERRRILLSKAVAKVLDRVADVGMLIERASRGQARRLSGSNLRDAGDLSLRGDDSSR